jgi:hypothetical protein
MDIHDDVSHNINNDVTHDVDHNARDVICDIQFSIFF